MPANNKVSVCWQIVFTFLPVLNFWASYRIRKLRKHVLHVTAPEIAVSVFLAYISFSGAWWAGTAWGDNRTDFGDFTPLGLSLH
jgi:hypothetical protein